MGEIMLMDGGYVLHIVHGDKFTSGYVNFMKKYIKKEQLFLVMESKYKYSFCDNKNIAILNRGMDLVLKKKNRIWVRKAKKIIVSGVFNRETYMALYNNKVLGKVYLHFWGGDFYCLRDSMPVLGVRSRIYKFLRLRCMKRCRAYVFLLDTEHIQFEKICKYRKPCLVASMPADPMVMIDYKELMRDSDKEKGEQRIIIGNSATKENHHVEVFDLLKRHKEEGMEVFVPLSYGDMNYKKEVMENGVEILGDAFVPIEDYMDKETYYRLLSLMDVGIFNNDRQQAMGNISMLLRMGKKIYLRKGTSMWDYYLAAGAVISDVEELKGCTYEDLFSYDVKDKVQSIHAIETISDNKRKIAQWEKIINA